MKEVTKWDNNPREMWVWDGCVKDKKRRKVIYINEENKEQPVIALTEAGFDTLNYAHCAEIEKSKYRPMTNQELAWWLLDGIKDRKHREWKLLNYDSIFYGMIYKESEANQSVGDNLFIRENGGEWHEPLVEVIE